MRFAEHQYQLLVQTPPSDLDACNCAQLSFKLSTVSPRGWPAGQTHSDPSVQQLH
jgi:hypothetical protein